MLTSQTTIARLTATVLFFALATADYTTTLWLTKLERSDKYGYIASLIDASPSHLTMSLNYDTNTNKTALNIGDLGGETYTFARSGFTLNRAMTELVPTPSGDVNLRVECTQPAQLGDAVQCTQISGDEFVRSASCGENRVTDTSQLPPNVTSTYAHTYGTGLWGPSGVETITWTIDWPGVVPSTTPAWCESGDVPVEAMTVPYTTDADGFAIYRVVVTAGEEKLSKYSGESAGLTGLVTGSTATAQVTGSTASAGSLGSSVASATSSALPESTGAAGKVSAVVPAFAGLGIAAVMAML